MAKYGLDPVVRDEQEADTLNAEVFIEHLEKQVPNNEHPTEHLAAYQLRALAILNGKEEHTLSDAKAVYMKSRGWSEDTTATRKQRNNTDASFRLVLDHLGDRSILKYRRVDVTSVIERALASGLKTATIRKRLGTVRAAVTTLIEQYPPVSGLLSPLKIIY